MIEHRVHDRDSWPALLAGLAGWDAGGAPVPALHVGDLGWAARDPDDRLAVHGWWGGGVLVAVALVEGPLRRPRLAPDRLHDPEVAAAVAAVVDDLDGSREAWSDDQPGGALHDALASRGWVADVDDPWVCLHLDLTTWDGPPEPVAADQARTCPDDRVAVQRAGFEGSSFTREKWERLAAGTAYDPALDLVVRAADGSPAAAGTAWLAAPGGTALLEPVSTHRDHRRAGHGRRLVHALAHACREAGASGLTVWTPQRNTAAVQAYAAAGFVTADVVCGLTVAR